MKIQDVICEVYQWQMPVPANLTAEYPYPYGEIPLDILRIISDDGTEGLFLRPDVSLSQSNVNDIRRELIGRDPFDREWIWQSLWGSSRRKIRRDGYMKVLAAVDIALWDLAGKALGLPVYKLIGAYRDKLKTYASSSADTVQEYQEQVIDCKRHRVAGYKIHPGSRDAEQTIQLCRAVREGAGDDYKLMLDNAGSTIDSREDAFRVGRALEELNFYWYEEPLRDYDIEGYTILREKLDIPICAVENVTMGMFDVPQYILRRAVDIVRADTRLYGGITPCKRVADLCGVFGMMCEIHAGTHLFDLANLHVECAIKNSEFHELFWPAPTSTELPLKELPYHLDNEGYIHLPQKPGLGFEIDWQALGKPIRTL